MRYLILCCFDEKQWETIPHTQREGIMRDYGELIRSLDQSGHHLAGAQLKPISAATTVRGVRGTQTITDGPFAETKEQIGGYHLMECKDLDEAIDIAKRIPTLAVGGAVEIRPLEMG